MIFSCNFPIQVDGESIRVFFCLDGTRIRFQVVKLATDLSGNEGFTAVTDGAPFARKKLTEK